MPSRWPRVEWEDALVKEPHAEGVRIAFLKCDDCVPPRVLTPMFDAARLRDVKRWVRGHEPGEPPAAEFSADLEVLGIAIADRPGAETVQTIALAREFARSFRADFDAVLRVDCVTGTLADMAGDLAWQVGLHLEGELADNIDHQTRFSLSRIKRGLARVHVRHNPNFVFGPGLNRDGARNIPQLQTNILAGGIITRQALLSEHTSTNRSEDD
jgi:hypothetical protein